MNEYDVIPMNLWIGKFDVVEHTAHDLKGLKLITDQDIAMIKNPSNPAKINSYTYQSVMRLASIIHNQEEKYVWLEGVKPDLSNISFLVTSKGENLVLVELPVTIFPEPVQKNFGAETITICWNIGHQYPELEDDNDSFMSTIASEPFAQALMSGGSIMGKFDDKEFKIIPIVNDDYREKFKHCFGNLTNQPTLVTYTLASIINDSLAGFIRNDMLQYISGVVNVTNDDGTDWIMVGLSVFGMEIVIKVKVTPLTLNPPMDVTGDGSDEKEMVGEL